MSVADRIEWGYPPPPPADGRIARRGPALTAPIIEQARIRPGEWGRIRQDDRHAGTVLAARLRRHGLDAVARRDYVHFRWGA
jgi:hypothetical protein